MNEEKAWKHSNILFTSYVEAPKWEGLNGGGGRGAAVAIAVATQEISDRVGPSVSQSENRNLIRFRPSDGMQSIQLNDGE